jgi:hypothetical protein
MERNLMWIPWNEPGLDYLRLVDDANQLMLMDR